MSSDPVKLPAPVLVSLLARVSICRSRSALMSVYVASCSLKYRVLLDMLRLIWFAQILQLVCLLLKLTNLFEMTECATQSRSISRLDVYSVGFDLLSFSYLVQFNLVTFDVSS